MASSNDPNMGLFYGWSLGEDGWNVGMDQNMQILGGMAMLSVKSRQVTAAPGSPSNGDIYYVPTGSTGIWASQINNIAIYSDFQFAIDASGWLYITVLDGWQFRIENELGSDGQMLSVFYDGAALQESIDLSNFVEQDSSYTATGVIDFTNTITRSAVEIATTDDISTAISAQDFSDFVHLTGSETITGDKTFTATVSGIDAVALTDLATLQNVQDEVDQVAGSSVGGFVDVFKNKTGDTLNFRTVQSSDASITITQNTDDIDYIVNFPAAGVTTFLALTDVNPTTYVGEGGNFTTVNSGETGLEFTNLSNYVAEVGVPISFTTTDTQSVSLESTQGDVNINSPLGDINITAAVGNVLLTADPTVALGAATKQYVDNTISVFDPSSDQTITGRWGFQIASGGTESFWVGNADPFSGGTNYFYGLEDATSSQYSFRTIETASSNGSNASLLLDTTKTGGSLLSLGSSAGTIVFNDDGEGTVEYIQSSLQTASMLGGTSDNYIATKKYVDDSTGTFNPAADESITGTWDYTVSAGAAESFTIANGASTNTFGVNAEAGIRFIEAYSQETVTTNGTDGTISIFADDTDGLTVNLGPSTCVMTLRDDGESTENYADLSLQTSSMVGGTPDDYLATKKYVDDNVGLDPSITILTSTVGNVTATASEEILCTVGCTNTHAILLPASPATGDKVTVYDDSYGGASGGIGSIQTNGGGNFFHDGATTGSSTFSAGHVGETYFAVYDGTVWRMRVIAGG